MHGSGLKVQGTGHRVHDLRFRGEVSGLRIRDLRLRAMERHDGRVCLVNRTAIRTKESRDRTAICVVNSHAIRVVHTPFV